MFNRLSLLFFLIISLESKFNLKIQFVESIKIKNNKIYNIEYHNIRYNDTRKYFFNINDKILLENYIQVPDNLKNELIKCRIIYNREIVNVEYHIYKMKNIRFLKIVFSDEIDYTYKYSDKKAFNRLLELKKNCDDILIIKNNKVTDSSSANIIFYDGYKWFTPCFPLLKGTKRQMLIDKKIIFERDISFIDIKNFYKARLVNAMIDFEDKLDIPIKNILL